jgi:NAD(P)H-dependent nitrite reductase small subunit
MKSSAWVFACGVEDLLPDAGVAVLLEDKQIAVFRLGESVYALDNFDPNSAANVLARGILGDLNGEPVVASPLYKHHFSLINGRCIENPERSVRAYPARVLDGSVWIKPVPLRAARKRKLVVIGNGMAGMRVVETLLELAPNAYEICVFGAEPHPNYNRIMLSPVLAGEKRPEDIVLNTHDWYRERGIGLHVADPIVAIDRVKRRVRAKSGTEVDYDRLVLAPGSKPIVLPIPGADLDGVVTFRDLDDVDAMLSVAQPDSRAVVIGGGLLGLEAAHGLSKRGMHVTVVHLFDTLMERQLDRVAGSMLQEALQRRGIEFRMSTQTIGLAARNDVAVNPRARVGAVQLDDGRELAADLVVMAVGIRPNTELARASGLRCDRGVIVNDTMQTYDPSVYAVGECVQHRDRTYGLVAPLFEQAKVCAAHLAEFGIGRFAGGVAATQLKVTGIDVFSAGDFLGGPDSEALVLRDARRGIYKRIVIERNTVRGAVLYGDVRDSGWYLDLMTSGADITKLRDTLLFGPKVAKGA